MPSATLAPALDGLGHQNAAPGLVVTGSESRLYLLKLDETAGTLGMDDAFQDNDRKPGFNFADRDWLYGSKGFGLAHGVVFSR